MNNGARKGGEPEAWQVVKSSPGLEDLWQLHYALAGGKEHNVADSYIANPDEKCAGKYLELSARPDGSFTVMNSRNGLLNKWFDYRLENDPRFLRRIESARQNIRMGHGVRLEDVAD